MTLNSAKLRSIVNLLSDSLQAEAAAAILTREARARGVLVADLVAEALAPAPSHSPPPDHAPTSSSRPASAPAFSDVDDGDPKTTIASSINSDFFGLRGEILAETERAWLARAPGGGKTWLPKSQVRHHGGDAAGRAILILPMWLARKKGFV
jgi:hypothetical protein